MNDILKEAQRESPSSAWDRCAEKAAQMGEKQCEATRRYGAGCEAFISRGMRCPECPRGYADEIRELIGNYEPSTGEE